MKVKIWRSGSIGFDVSNAETGEIIKSFSDIDSSNSQDLDGILALRYCKENDYDISVDGASEHIDFPKMPNIILLKESLEELQDKMNEKTIQGYVVAGGISYIEEDEFYVIPMTLLTVISGTWKPKKGFLPEEYV